MTVTQHAVTVHVVRIEDADKEDLCDLLKQAAAHVENFTNDEITDVTVPLQRRWRAASSRLRMA